MSQFLETAYLFIFLFCFFSEMGWGCSEEWVKLGHNSNSLFGPQIHNCSLLFLLFCLFIFEVNYIKFYREKRVRCSDVWGWTTVFRSEGRETEAWRSRGVTHQQPGPPPSVH